MTNLSKSAWSTHTYFIGDREQFSLPIISLTGSEKDLFDYDERIMVAGRMYDEWIISDEGKNADSPRRSRSNWL